MQRDRSHLIRHQRVGDSVRAVRAVWNSQVFLTETRFVTDGQYRNFIIGWKISYCDTNCLSETLVLEQIYQYKE